MKKVILWLVVVVSVFAIGACGGDDDEAGQGQGADTGGETEALKVSLIPIIDYAPLYLGIQEGFFEEEGLRVEPQIVQGGPAITASVVSGEAQIGGLAAVPALQAETRNIPITIVAPANSAPEEGQTGIVVAEDSGIESVHDLNGKRVGVNALRAFADLLVRGSVDKLGGDSSAIEFTTVDFPEMVAALGAGRVDAAFVAEPFLTAAQEAGHRVLTYSAAEIQDRFTISVWIAGREYVEENPDVMERFQRAIVKANEFAQENPEAVREILPTYTRIAAPMASKVSLPIFDSELNRDSLELQADLMVEYDFVEQHPNVDELIYEP